MDDELSAAAIRLLNDGVVKVVVLDDGQPALQIAAPILGQRLQYLWLDAIQSTVQLPDPPMDGGKR